MIYIKLEFEGLVKGLRDEGASRLSKEINLHVTHILLPVVAWLHGGQNNNRPEDCLPRSLIAEIPEERQWWLANGSTNFLQYRAYAPVV